MKNNDDIINRLLDTQESIASDITEIKVILAKQEVSLDTHIKRTNLAEENIALVREELEPVKDHVKMVNNIFKLIGFISVIITIIVGILKIRTYIF